MKVTFLTDKDKLILDGQISQLSENVEELKENAVTGKDGISVTHEWNGTVLKITSASGTSSVDLKGEKGETGADGTSVTVTNVSESTIDGGSNVVTFSDGKTVTIKNGSKGSQGEKGDEGWNGNSFYTTVASSPPPIRKPR